MADTNLNSGKGTMLLAGGLIRIEKVSTTTEYAVQLVNESWGSFTSGGRELINYSNYMVLQPPLAAMPVMADIALNVHSVAPSDPTTSFWAILNEAHASGEVFEIDVMEFHVPTNPHGTAGIIYAFTNVHLMPNTLRYQPGGEIDQVQAQFQARGNGTDTRPTLTAYS